MSAACSTPARRLAEILTIGDVQVEVDASSKAQLFEQVGALFESRYAIDHGKVVDHLIARERLGSTGLGHGVAIPHARIKGLKTPLAAVLRLRVPIAFDAPDQEPVGLFVFLLVPEAATQQHLEILAEIAAMLSDRVLRDRLASATDAAALHAAIAHWLPDSPPTRVNTIAAHRRPGRS